MSLLRFWALNVSVALLSMEGQKALRFHPKYLNLFSEDERRSYRFGTTWGWVINDRILIFHLSLLCKASTEMRHRWKSTPNILTVGRPSWNILTDIFLLSAKYVKCLVWICTKYKVSECNFNIIETAVNTRVKPIGLIQFCPGVTKFGPGGLVSCRV